MKANPVVDRGEHNPSGTYWRKVAEVLKKPGKSPRAGEVWGNNSPVFVILKSEAPQKLVLATICIGPGVKDYTASDLQKYLQKRGLKRLGEIQTT